VVLLEASSRHDLVWLAVTWSCIEEALGKVARVDERYDLEANDPFPGC